MALGTALLIIAVLYLIDRHGLWKRAGQGVLGLVILAALVAGGWYGVSEYRTWRLGRDIKTAQSLGLCIPASGFSDLPPGATIVSVPWVPVLTPVNELRCVDADKVNLEVPPNRIVLSQVDITIWRQHFDAKPFDPNAPYSSVPVQTQAGYDACMKHPPAKSDPYAAIAVCIPVGATIPPPPSGSIVPESQEQLAREYAIEQCIAKSTPAGNQTALDEQRRWCEQHPDKPVILEKAPVPDPAARFGGKTRQRVECYKDGKLVSDSFAQFGGVIVKCAPDEVQVNR
jgi:hypothetical protein